MANSTSDLKMKVNESLCVGLSTSGTPCVKTLPKTEVVVRSTANPREIIAMQEFVMASVPSALGAACVQLAKLSLIWLALQLFYDNKQVLFPWHNVNLHLKTECFLS